MRTPTPAATIRSDERYAWLGQSLLVTIARGDCDESVPIAGYYFREARDLRKLVLCGIGRAPGLC